MARWRQGTWAKWIGLSTALMMLFDGWIAGISGLVVRKGSEVGWRAMLAVGLLLGAVV